MWQAVLDVVDAVESWIAGQSYWVQVVLLLAVLGPLCYLLAGLIDRADVHRELGLVGAVAQEPREVLALGFEVLVVHAPNSMHRADGPPLDCEE